MKVLLDIDDKMVLHLMVILKGLPYVKTEELTYGKAKLIREIKEALIEVDEIKAGKKSGRNVKDFLNEL